MLSSIAAAGFPSEEPVTHDLLNPIRPLRIAVSWALLPPVVLAAAGSGALTRGLGASPRVRFSLHALWATACATTVAYAILWTIGYFFATPTILEDPAYVLAVELCRRVAVPLALLSSAGTALVVRRAGRARTTLALLAAFACAVAVVFAATGADAVPPAIVVLVWVPCAVIARRGLRAMTALQH